MSGQYTSFLIRCWRREGGKHHIKIEHVQSGEVAQLDTLAHLITWIEARWNPGSTDLMMIPDLDPTTEQQIR
ncbi:hypothetical protein KSD_57070 [Ktedonobacter sp. SOSP1-85]|uniref:hypothetical protein n=1 Tax=Ktedonobacter sp. SOSP1-85 TaxID=2778367 RepID=UPI0019157414|nr:hypothetical protein [Ktedonobacter sp. SOSP1-85]GHO77936.1 hypothetical protein KSD_57070 [Ktedonobacter sp. SOSP1-85]